MAANKISKEFIEGACKEGLLDVNARTSRGFPLLHQAANAVSFNKEAFEILVKKGANVDAVTGEGMPLLYCTANSLLFNRGAFEAFVAAGADVNAQTAEKVSIICECLRGMINHDSLNAFFKHGAKLPKEKPGFVSSGDWLEAQQELENFHSKEGRAYPQAKGGYVARELQRKRGAGAVFFKGW